MTLTSTPRQHARRSAAAPCTARTGGPGTSRTVRTTTWRYVLHRSYLDHTCRSPTGAVCTFFVFKKMCWFRKGIYTIAKGVCEGTQPGLRVLPPLRDSDPQKLLLGPQDIFTMDIPCGKYFSAQVTRLVVIASAGAAAGGSRDHVPHRCHGASRHGSEA